jgi:hypothetical protein
MVSSLSASVKRSILLSTSSLALVAASSAPILAQNENTSQAPPAAVGPQAPDAAPPPSSPTTTPKPEPESSTPAASQTPAPATPQQATGANVLPETRVVAPV